jgi:hypothetical protein
MIRILLASVFLAALTACSNQSASKPAPASAPSAAAPAAPAATPAPAAQAATAPAPAGALATQDTNVPGIAADFTECKRKEGVLSVKLRFRNTSSAETAVPVISARNYEAFYVAAANKKYFILKDSEGTYLTPSGDGFGNLSVHLPTNQQYTWWAKFPAPPADVKKVTLMTPLAPPFEDIPVTDQ